jgi:hypothetical protein
VPDGGDDHSEPTFVDPIDNAMIPPGSAMKTFELTSERMADPQGHLGQRSVDELDGGKSYIRRKPRDGTLGRSGPLNRIPPRR